MPNISNMKQDQNKPPNGRPTKINSVCIHPITKKIYKKQPLIKLEKLISSTWNTRKYKKQYIYCNEITILKNRNKKQKRLANIKYRL